MLDRRIVGRTYETGSRRIEASAVRAYAGVIEDANPAYRSGAVPPLFASVFCLRPPAEALFADPEVGLDLAHLVHGEQRFVFHRPPRVGEEVRCRGRIADLQARRNLDFVTFETEAVDAVGIPICSATALFVIRNP